MADVDNIYRIMILYMLDKARYPLSNSQITNLMLQKEYTTYFTVQQTLVDLETSQLIISESSYNRTRYMITDEGRESLGFFEDKINDSVKEDILSYFEEHDFELNEESLIYADYYRSSCGGYDVVCRAGKYNKPDIELKLAVSSKDQALAVCRNWQEQNGEVFELIMDKLLI